MNRDWIKLQNRKCKEYIEGVNSFLEVAKNVLVNGRTRCPCKKCCIVSFADIEVIEAHLYKNGMSPTYSRWVMHGEKADLSVYSKEKSSVIKEPILKDNSSTLVSKAPVPTANSSKGDTEIADILNDLRGPILDNDHGNDLSKSVNEKGSRGVFGELLDDARKQLYPGCERFSTFSFLAKMMHLKVSNNWSNRSFDLLLQLVREAFPEGTNLPASFYDAKKRLRDMGLGYKSIHACKYDCVLFWKEYEKCEHCPMCGESRYKVDDSKGKKLPHKVLYHFPLIPRLQQLFLSKHRAHDMRWHKDKRVEVDGVLRHPADAKGWKHFDREFPQFAADPRNVRLSLALGGFNPFENTSTYNMWPVTVIPYNVPPEKCMKENSFFMSLLIPGPQSPGKEIDVYMQPLIAELKQLWSVGCRTFDSYKDEYFQLHAALLWTISDFPIYADLSGWNIKGDKACPICNEDTFSMKLRERICFVGHRCYLPANHKWRKSKQHDGEEEHMLQPKIRNGEEILNQVNAARFSKFGKNPSKQKKKRKRDGNEINWTKRSIFFELPYWSKLMLRHKFDVMHIERSICDNVVSTLLNVDGETKDTFMARLDLEDLKIRKELHIQKNEDKYLKPHASYTLTDDEKVNFCKFLRSVTFPIGFASNISRCVNIKDGKIRGLKSYDFHVLLHRLLPFGIRPYLRKDICTAITEMSNFFRKLCAKTLRSQDLDMLQDEIVKILCKFEKIFPPTFFDVMMHLAIHLPHEVGIVGPINYSCMYPVDTHFRPVIFFRIQELQFPNWFKNHVQALHQAGNISDELYSLASGPDLHSRSHSGCIVNGLLFHTKDHDRGTTQNSGVVCPGEHDKENINFYGMLSEVLELHYLNEHRVFLFKCDWFDTDPKKDRIWNELGFISINISSTWYKDCPFIFASEAEQVFYLDDYKFGKDWKVVQFVQHRHLWDIPEIEDDGEHDEDQSSEPSDLALARKLTIDDSVEFGSLNRKDVEPSIIEGYVAGMNVEFNENELEDDDSISDYNSDSYNALSSNNSDDERDGGLWSL